MASSCEMRSWLLTAGGVMSIIGGAFEIIGGLITVVLTVGGRILLGLVPGPFRPDGWWRNVMPGIPFWLIILGLPLLVLGIVAIVGGVSALRRQNFGLSLAGAICALPSNILGILAIIFISLSKKEFEARE